MVGSRSFLIMLILIMISRETILFGTNVNHIFITLRNFIALLWLPIFFIQYNQTRKYNKFSSKEISILVLMFFCIFFSGAVNADISIEYFFRIVIIISGFLYAAVTPIKTFMVAFEKVLFFIASYSLVVYIVSFLAPSIIATFPVVTNSESLKYYNLLFTCIPRDLDIRLYGPFREPGVYIIYLNLALIFHIVNNEKVNFWKIGVLIASIILSYSTTGYIALLFVLLFYLFKNNNTNNKKQKYIIIIILFAAILVLWSYTEILSIDGLVFGKIGNMDSESSVARFSSVTANLRIFATSPIFGVGLKHLADLFPRYSILTFGYASTNTNTILMQFAAHGLLYGSVFFIGLLKFFKKLSARKLLFVFLCGVGVVIFSGEDIIGNILVYILIGYGYNKESLNKRGNMNTSRITT